MKIHSLKGPRAVEVFDTVAMGEKEDAIVIEVDEIMTEEHSPTTGKRYLKQTGMLMLDDDTSAPFACRHPARFRVKAI